MRSRAAREARDPWGVITHAVRITCVYKERAQGLLCSVHQARRTHVSAFHDPDRFSTRAYPIVDDHPVLKIIDEQYSRAEESEGTATPVLTDISQAIEFLVLLGWPDDVAQGGVEQICDALIRTGARSTAWRSGGIGRFVCCSISRSHRGWCYCGRCSDTPNPCMRPQTLA